MSNTLMTIPLCQLKRSKDNIRKTEPLVGIEELAASIQANGVLENLVVFPIDRPDPAEPEFYEVVAGARRLAALKLLLKRKKVVRDLRVPCLVLERSGAATPVEVSLAENIVRAPLHPADQFEAFLKLQKEGLPAEDIAARFGISATVVSQRLKLAAVSPRLMVEYRSGEMTLEQLMAFTITNDHKAQDEAWFENPYGDSSPQAIRRYLTKSHVEGGDRRARFIGAKAYEEAGGIVVRDLFQPEDEGYFTDS
jgi:ParB family chromosome partitioning protein